MRDKAILLKITSEDKAKLDADATEADMPVTVMIRSKLGLSMNDARGGTRVGAGRPRKPEYTPPEAA